MAYINPPRPSQLSQLPYTSAAYDNTSYGIALWAALNAGTYGAIAAYTPPS